MKSSDLIEKLEALKEQHGDRDVLMDVGAATLITIDECDLDYEENGFILWKPEHEYLEVA